MPKEHDPDLVLKIQIKANGEITPQVKWQSANVRNILLHTPTPEQTTLRQRGEKGGVNAEEFVQVMTAWIYYISPINLSRNCIHNSQKTELHSKLPAQNLKWEALQQTMTVSSKYEEGMESKEKLCLHEKEWSYDFQCNLCVDRKLRYELLRPTYYLVLLFR